jgi:hypothetical protein
VSFGRGQLTEDQVMRNEELVAQQENNRNAMLARAAQSGMLRPNMRPPQGQFGGPPGLNNGMGPAAPQQEPMMSDMMYRDPRSQEQADRDRETIRNNPGLYNPGNLWNQPHQQQPQQGYPQGPVYRGGQDPRLGRYRPPQMNYGNDGWADQGGYSYNLPNPFGPYPNFGQGPYGYGWGGG